MTDDEEWVRLPQETRELSERMLTRLLRAPAPEVPGQGEVELVALDEARARPPITDREITRMMAASMLPWLDCSPTVH